MKHIDIKVEGHVQGVFFRKKAMETAIKLGLVGFVRNEDDGTVYIEAEGQDLFLDEFVKWCQVGSDGAEVSNVVVKSGKLKEFEEFKIEY